VGRPAPCGRPSEIGYLAGTLRGPSLSLAIAAVHDDGAVRKCLSSVYGAGHTGFCKGHKDTLAA
jgi:hypothetical protein